MARMPGRRRSAEAGSEPAVEPPGACRRHRDKGAKKVVSASTSQNQVKAG